MVGTFLLGGFRIEVSHGGKNGLAVEHVPIGVSTVAECVRGPNQSKILKVFREAGEELE